MPLPGSLELQLTEDDKAYMFGVLGISVSLGHRGTLLRFPSDGAELLVSSFVGSSTVPSFSSRCSVMKNSYGNTNTALSG